MQEHKKVQKRALVSEKSEVAALLVHLNIKLGTYGLRSYGPPEGLAPAVSTVCVGRGAKADRVGAGYRAALGCVFGCGGGEDEGD